MDLELRDPELGVGAGVLRGESRRLLFQKHTKEQHTSMNKSNIMGMNRLTFAQTTLAFLTCLSVAVIIFVVYVHFTYVYKGGGQHVPTKPLFSHRRRSAPNIAVN